MKEGVWNKRSGKGDVFGQNVLSVDQGVIHYSSTSVYRVILRFIWEAIDQSLHRRTATHSHVPLHDRTPLDPVSDQARPSDIRSVLRTLGFSTREFWLYAACAPAALGRSGIREYVQHGLV